MNKLDKFIVEQVLQTSEAEKLTILLGKVDDVPCIAKISRLPLPDFNINGKLPLSVHEQLDANDIYSWGSGKVDENASVYIECIMPATDTHIAKYKEAQRFVVRETPEMYTNTVKPYIETQRGDRIDWVRGILFQGVEADRVLFRDDQFVLLPNSKWDQQNVNNMSMLALVVQTDIPSIRDLTSAHIPLLEHIKSKSSEVISSKWNVPESQLKVFFHYHPTFYHLHVHIVHINNEQNDFGRSLLVDSVIDMLDSKPIKDHTLTYFMSENHKLYNLLFP
ncbi:5'-(N(7)-methyl 5'-triphosphoguanosine)-(mRNA) diphosphatase [Starmerella bacillaris]|uniref:5'-(N(7)-methyl 5'-triphosphoguanosine)-(mRNA) diphosphatase n=1 Tax=Starmerella bacillaris TaxID=1247836 RepID=A0AAV5RHR5_STABA|nr:5'-(N(7)-methyl 5'-triphosphoguanosine)-(mRNA) diphosphatase [Starmerella bacillaris]